MISTVLLSSQPVSGLWYALGVGRLAYKRNARSLRHGFEVVQKLEGACEPSQSNRNSQGKGKTPRSEQKRIDLMERGGTACERGMTSKNLRRPREILFPALILRQRSEDAWKVPAVVVREKRRPAKATTTINNCPHLRVHPVPLHDGYDLRRVVIFHGHHEEAAVRAEEVLEGRRNRSKQLLSAGRHRTDFLFRRQRSKS